MHEHLKWSDDMSVGFDHIDEQHKNIINLINILGDAVDNGYDISPHDFLNQVHRHVFEHFVDEEKLMVENDYDWEKYRDHLIEHNEFRSRVANYTLDLVEDKIDLVDVYGYLRSWFGTHTLNKDQDYARYIAEKLDK